MYYKRFMNWTERVAHNLSKFGRLCSIKLTQLKLRFDKRKIATRRGEMLYRPTEELERLAGLWKNPRPAGRSNSMLADPSEFRGFRTAFDPFADTLPINGLLGIGAMSLPVYGDCTDKLSPQKLAQMDPDERRRFTK